MREQALRVDSGLWQVHAKESLLADAAEFEQVAVGVQMQLMKIDSLVALECCELPTSFWKGLTSVDLAVRGGSEAFVERCCAEALQNRWAGDIHPHDQPFGLYPTVLLCVLSLGLLAPSLLVFRPPPRSEVLRAPAQRRTVSKAPRAHAEKKRCCC